MQHGDASPELFTFASTPSPRHGAGAAHSGASCKDAGAGCDTSCGGGAFSFMSTPGLRAAHTTLRSTASPAWSPKLRVQDTPDDKALDDKSLLDEEVCVLDSLCHVSTMDAIGDKEFACPSSDGNDDEAESECWNHSVEDEEGVGMTDALSLEDGNPAVDGNFSDEDFEEDNEFAQTPHALGRELFPGPEPEQALQRKNGMEAKRDRHLKGARNRYIV